MINITRKMCGIWAWIHNHRQARASLMMNGVRFLEARGPEGTRFVDVSGGATMAFTRLAINGLNDLGMQPFMTQKYIWMCNGEIYNSMELQHTLSYSPESGSDCEILGKLWETVKDAKAFARALDGVFAIVLYEVSTSSWLIARDPYGVRPLFWSFNHFSGWMFASERKALEGFSSAKIYEFPPGEVWRIKGVDCVREVYHTVPWIKAPWSGPDELRIALTEAVRKRVNSTERPVAALLSGGLDSSLICALVQRLLVESRRLPLQTFSIGMAGSSDLKYAKMVAEYIGSNHTELIVTADEMFDCIPEVIRDIESYDITSVRASVGNWMIARHIREKTDCKVVFNGDGSDEVFGSYLYFYKAPSDYEFESESQRLLQEIHKYDVLRSDRCISSHGLEARTPYLDKQFVAVAMGLPTGLRRPIKGIRVEKKCLRDAFVGYLPDEVLWRKKEAFSDGVSSTERPWYEEIQMRVNIEDDWQAISGKFEEPKPLTPEAYYYRKIYESHYKNTGEFMQFWMPKWSPETTDPSAKTLVGV